MSNHRFRRLRRLSRKSTSGLTAHPETLVEKRYLKGPGQADAHSEGITPQGRGTGSASGGDDVIKDENLDILYPFECRVVGDEAGCPGDNCCCYLDHVRHELPMNCL